MRSIVLSLVFVFFMLSSRGNERTGLWQEANAAYNKADYKKAVKLYEDILSSGSESSDLYYNLGNAYFKEGNVPYAILNYERAKKLKPGDDDIEYNLQLANQKIVDKIEPLPKLLIGEVSEGLVQMFSEKGWSLMCMLAFLAALLFFAIYISSSIQRWRQLLFGLGSLSVMMAISFYIMAFQSKNISETNKEAIVISPSITLKSAPVEAGKKLFILHEGTKVKVQKTEGDWQEIRIADGNVGWVASSSLAAI